MRATRPATITGFSAATSILAASCTAAESPCGGALITSLGMRRFFSVTGSSCKRAIGDDDHRLVRRRHRDLVSAHGGFGEVSERDRRVVPLDEIAHHRGGVLHAVHPLRIAAAVVHVENVAENDVHRHAIGVAVVDRHRRVLQADGCRAP